MIHEEICAYELCKLAKKKGFNEYEACNHIYEDDEQWHTLTTYTNAKGIDWSKDKFTVAPTQSLLQRWLREEKGIIVEVSAFPNEKKEFIFDWVVLWNPLYIADSDAYSNGKNYPTYELTLEDALKYTLENLV